MSNTTLSLSTFLKTHSLMVKPDVEEFLDSNGKWQQPGVYLRLLKENGEELRVGRTALPRAVRVAGDTVNEAVDSLCETINSYRENGARFTLDGNVITVDGPLINDCRK